MRPHHGSTVGEPFLVKQICIIMHDQVQKVLVLSGAVFESLDPISVIVKGQQ